MWYQWTDEEDERLIDLIGQGAHPYDLVQALPGKNQHAIRVRRKLLTTSGKLVPRPKWIPKEDAVIISMTLQGATSREIAKHFPYQTYTTVKRRILALTKMGMFVAPQRCWSADEDSILILLTNNKTSPKNIKSLFPNDTLCAIKHRIARLRKKGSLPPTIRVRKGKPAVSYHMKAWNRREIKLLREFTIAQGLGACEIFKRELLPDRSIDAIAQQIRRMDYANPKRQTAARKAYQRRMLTIGVSFATMVA